MVLIVLNSGIYSFSNDSNVFNFSGGTIGAYSYGNRSQFPIDIRYELRTKFKFYVNGNDPVKFVSNVDTAAFNFAIQGITPAQVADYVSKYITGYETCDLSGPAHSSREAALYSVK